MDEGKNKDLLPDGENPGDARISKIQEKIQDKIANDEKTLKGEALSGELSKDRTHMSEHRTEMSEHRTGLSEKRTGMSEHRTELSEKRTDMSDERTQLSYQRTILSYERTLMSWIRTSTSLISFGFTMYKIFEELTNSNDGPKRVLTPRVVGMMFIGFGLVGLLLAQIQHQIAIKKITQKYPEAQKSLSSLLSILVLVFGLLLFFGALFRQ